MMCPWECRVTLDELYKLITGAVACLLPAVTWATFCATRRDRQAERRSSQLRMLTALDAELAHIENWGGTQYGDTTEDLHWYDTNLAVRPIPTPILKEFTTTVPPEEFGKGLSDALVKLEGSLRRFHELLVEQHAFLERLDREDSHSRERIRTCLRLAGLGDGHRQLTDGEIGELRGISLTDKQRMRDYYALTKDIHLRGIGTEGGSGLYEYLRAARGEWRATRARIVKGGGHGAFWIGHVLALVIGVIGLVLLGGVGVVAWRMLR